VGLYTIGGFIRGLVLTAVVGVGGWFLVGQDIVDDIQEQQDRGSGGGPFDQRLVSAKRFAPIVAQLREREGRRAPMVTVVMRADSVEFVLRERGELRGWRWRGRKGPLRPFEPQAGADRVYLRRTWPLSRLDARAPGRISRSISEREGGDFRVSISDVSRAGSGRITWIARGLVGERGVAYAARADGRGIGPYNPALPNDGAR
jgi:hypothetical protein